MQTKIPRRKYVAVILILFTLSNMHGDIPQNIMVDDKASVVYEVIDKERCKIIVTIDNAKYEDTFYYSMIAENETSTIPLPAYLGAYKDAVILIKGYGFSYRNLIVYQKVKNSIIKKEFENSLSMEYLPREEEKYVFMYETNPILIINSWKALDFIKINKKIKGDVSYIEIFSDEIILNIENSKEQLKFPADLIFNQQTPTQSVGVCCSHKVLQSDLIPFIRRKRRGIKPSARMKHWR